MDYLEVLKKADLSKQSITQYTSKLQGLMQITKHDIEWIIKNPSETKNIVFKTYMEAQTRKAYLVAVLALFKHVKDLKCNNGDSYDKYYKYHKEVNEEIHERYRSGVASDKQAQEYMAWPEIIQKRDEFGKKNYGSKEHLLISMYTYLPPVRQDFIKVKLIPKMPWGSKANEGNFIVLKSRGPSICVLNEYKTSSAHKHLRKDLPPELTKIIRKSMELQPRDYLFVDAEGKLYEFENSFYKWANRALSIVLGKPVTATMLRHSFIIDERKRGVTPGEEEDSAKWMGHSAAQKNEYRFAEPNKGAALP
jgi:hypothetical protein